MKTFHIIFRRPSLAIPLRVTAIGNLGSVTSTLLRDKDRPTTSIHDKQQELSKSSDINTTQHDFRELWERAPRKTQK
jgi:hypothetical protein